MDALQVGLTAYQQYHDVLARLAELTGMGIVPTVEIFSALSPNLDYKANLTSAIKVVCTRQKIPCEYSQQGYPANRLKAAAIANGDISFLDTVKGLKITAFRHNILYPDTSTVVTVDGHMYALKFPDLVKTMKQAAKVASPKNYRLIEAEIQAVARRHALMPHQVQAALWYDRRIKLNIYNTAQTHMFQTADGFDAMKLLSFLE